MRRQFRVAGLRIFIAAAALFTCPHLLAANATDFEERLPQIGPADYVQQLQSLRSSANACSASAFGCDAGRVPPNERVNLAGGFSFEAHYGWIRDALHAGKSETASERAAQMKRVRNHLDSDLADVQCASSTSDFAAARRQVNAILATREFNAVQEVSLKQQLLARFYAWIEQMLGHVAGFGSRAPWIAPLLEWLLGSLACSLLLVWAWRTARWQRVQMRIDSTRQIEQSEERALNWVRASEEHAAAGSFRDAVHCLYWASITLLEGRRLWNPDRARTPREYLRLLDPAGAAAPLLHRQTLSFEIIWYGLRPAARPDYESALHLYQELRSA